MKNQGHKHATTILHILEQAPAPLSAYDILEKTRHSGIKAPPTVYRALDKLMEQGHVHRIESLNAFVACHHDTPHFHNDSRFAICKHCGTTIEIHAPELDQCLEKLQKNIHFNLDYSIIELHGQCRDCATRQA